MKEDILRIISLGGFSSVTQNMFVYHFLPQGKEENDEILIVDCGAGFPEDDLLGVDLIIPDFSYLVQRQTKIVGMILTHGHEDHIGALPLFFPELKVSFPVFGSRLTVSLAESKLKEFGSQKRLRLIKDGDQFNLGKFFIEPIRITHSIPDSLHFLIKTPVGNFYHGADFKFDLTPLDGKFPDLVKIAELGKTGVTALFSDCLGSEHPGYSPSEKELANRFEDEIKKAKGRVLVTALSSNIYRWQQAIDASKKFGRKIVLVGMSVEKNVKLAQNLGYLDLDDKDLVKIERIKNYPDKRLTFLVGGSLAQTGSSLDRIVIGKHRVVLKPTDKVIFSSPDYIPGTSAAIYHLIDNLAKKGIEVVYRELEGSLHVSGHAAQQELALLINLVSPRWLVPIGGNYRHMRAYLGLVEKIGLDPARVIIPQENQGLLFNRYGFMHQFLEMPLRQVLVDGLGVGDVGQTVLRDRKILSREGMIVTICLIDSATKKLIGKPSVISRGFVYVKENKQLLEALKRFVEEKFSAAALGEMDLGEVRRIIQGEIEEEIYRTTGRQPMVLPVLIEV